MWRTWASPRRAQSNTSENDWVEVYSSLLQNTHTHTPPHPIPLITIPPPKKNTPDVLWRVIESEGLRHKVWRPTGCGLTFLIFLPSSFLQGPFTILCVIFSFPFCFCPFWQALLMFPFQDMLTGSWHGVSQIHMLSMAGTRGRKYIFICFSSATRVQSRVVQRSPSFPSSVTGMRWAFFFFLLLQAWSCSAISWLAVWNGLVVQVFREKSNPK